ncbi:PREDICTED: uncharacterized protein LOC109154667 [Ipomoea nil]|uniref:uncharacterized protein LOC109154667 n=1 Tax=Ipomoea nil TaxID=35883 RepID=UPI0009008AC0|nr:PREDICTED: uncharacterized protein LOC109154667 [Ipomoea nil]
MYTGSLHELYVFCLIDRFVVDYAVCVYARMAKPRKGKSEEQKGENTEAVIRHQKLCLSIDMEKRRIYGWRANSRKCLWRMGLNLQLKKNKKNQGLWSRAGF